LDWQSLTWLPTLIFSIISEADISLRWGVASLNIFFVLSFAFYFFGVRLDRGTEESCVEVVSEKAQASSSASELKIDATGPKYDS
jgi:hypothetical protein